MEVLEVLTHEEFEAALERILSNDSNKNSEQVNVPWEVSGTKMHRKLADRRGMCVFCKEIPVGGIVFTDKGRTYMAYVLENGDLVRYRWVRDDDGLRRRLVCCDGCVYPDND